MSLPATTRIAGTMAEITKPRVGTPKGFNFSNCLGSSPSRDMRYEIEISPTIAVLTADNSRTPKTTLPKNIADKDLPHVFEHVIADTRGAGSVDLITVNMEPI